MFKKIRLQLTCFYAVIMGTFFILLVFGAYKSMMWSITSEQEREALLFAEEEAYEHSFLFQHAEIFEKQKADVGNSGRMYFYVFDKQGKLMNAIRAEQRIEEAVMERIRMWDVPQGEVAILDPGDASQLMMAAMPVMYEDEKIGMVYVGRDVTAIYNGLRKSTLLLGAFSVVAFFFATLAGYLMSGKAIVPLKIAYEKQRQFAADASHELRTPLSVIMSSVDVLQNDQQNASPFIKQVLEDMKDEIKKMAKLVSDLLLVARSDNQGVKISKESFLLTDVVRQVLRKIQPLADHKQIKLYFSEKNSVVLYADLQRMKQLLFILIDNAIKYTTEKGMVTVKLDQTTNTGVVKILVSDTGIGIPDEDQSLIFDRFYRADKARSRESGGTGLGLAIAKGIVDLHHGEIKVESKVGSRSTFIVVLPK